MSIRISDIQQLLNDTSRPVIVEVGCNDGTDTLKFLDAFPSCEMHCFEPDTRAADRFLASVSDARVKLYPAAVGAENGTRQFYPSMGLPAPLPKEEAERVAARLPGGWDLSGSIRRPKNHLRHHPWCLFGEPVKVSIVRLDTWSATRDIERVDFLWADVQGAEEDLILGGLETLKRTRFFYTEWSDSELYEGQIGLRQIQSLLPDFRVVQLFNEDVLLENTLLRV